MGKRKIVRRRARHVRKTTRRHSLVLGLVHDLSFVLGLIITAVFTVLTFAVKIIGYPVRKFAHGMARVIKTQVRVHPQLHFLETHTFWSVSAGMVLLVVSFAAENLSHHFLWGCTVETARAAGVCPIWETIASLTKISEELS
jgi:hypothetical protein